MSALIKHRLLGVAFIGLLGLGVFLVNAIFSQQFIDYDYIALKASKIGLSLPYRADVKVRGMLVGEVTDTVSSGHGATLTLGIEPEYINAIPRNVTASLIPKTLFGEKYVSLVIPVDPDQQALANGDTINQTELPIEVEKVLNDLYPLLRTVQPAQINYTLNALATALEGRGEEIGHNIEVLGAYLQRFNPQVPTLMKDLSLLATVSDTYADVMPEIAATLRNTVKTGNTLLEKEQKLNSFLNDVTAFSNTANSFLHANGDNIIKLGRLSEAQLAVLAKYSPEFPCLLRGIVNAAPRQGDTFRGFIFHIHLRTLKKQPRGYTAREVPIYGDKRGPHCGTLPTPPWHPGKPFRNIPDLKDGAAKPRKRVAPTLGQAPLPMTGTPPERAIVKSLTAPVLGKPVDQVPDLTNLLYGPLVRGSEVSAR